MTCQQNRRGKKSKVTLKKWRQHQNFFFFFWEVRAKIKTHLRKLHLQQEVLQYLLSARVFLIDEANPIWELGKTLWMMLSHYLSPQGQGSLEHDRTHPPILNLSHCHFSLFDLFQELQGHHSWLTLTLPGTLLPRTAPTGSLAVTNTEGFLITGKKKTMKEKCWQLL